ncbi:diguanylate cyclase/phosphodiesterase [Cribrihabitans marinus]|uniref:Diguanylate cyclase/phosphodiesterase n=1 Tax=Cribrihabitans marinus TaxID=1227549 RepID=A0A1H7DVV9_9RHOB|nr:bifunctional diguanylate cyclase/phosphodiesterase [Cribrihabitans marinus]GGH40609.1 diguanylate cyclase [Cribrihabitans marinus]SEK05863.1 diguanylate cyclase/phosphodiesterase [Cribrihabitans marinus]
MRTISNLTTLRARILPILTGPPILAFLPALTLGAFWTGGEAALILVALGLPLFFALAGALQLWPPQRGVPRDAVTGLILRPGFEAALQEIHDTAIEAGLNSACFIIELDDHAELVERHGPSAGDLVARRSGERILSALRQADSVARLGEKRFAVCLAPVQQFDLELCIQLAGRIQAAIEDAISLDGIAVYVSCSIGFCQLGRARTSGGRDWLVAAAEALADARLHGPSAIRAYSARSAGQAETRSGLQGDIAAALESGQIQPWYQPQISTDTGKITGFEALARWAHPVRGTLGPECFLDLIEEAGLTQRLGQVMLYHALTALKAWDSAGLPVPRVAVNFAAAELRDPGLVDRIRWELDRFDLRPERLAVEILETVVATPSDDTIARNIAGLSALGCGIDLDDFGTGHTSIASIRRFDISRIKIDRSFVMKSDRDPEQQKLIGAILTMAERLDLETLAEGVETVGEHALLAQLGCDHVQGFGIGRPMPFDRTLDWISAHGAKLREAPRIGRQTG